jgi:glycosidase
VIGLLTLSLGLAHAEAPSIDSMYLVMVDRFHSGRTANDGDVDPDDPSAFHGGDLAGLMAKLDTIEALGVDTLWLTPIGHMREERIAEHGAFHGYWPDNNRRVAPRFGTRSDLLALREALEARGMKLILDAVLNHVGPETGLTQAHPDWFHSNGDITDWADPEQLRNNDVHGLPDLDQSNPEVVRHLVGDGHFWLRAARPDGFRVDAVRHIDPSFLKTWISKMSAKSTSPLIFAGEVFDGNPVAVATEVKATGLTHSFDFPLYYALTESICSDGDLRKIAAVLTQDRNYPAGHHWITFLDNHDTARVQTVCGEHTEAAFTLMTSLRGIPAFTWGTEAGFTGKTEAEARSSMRFDDLPHQGWIARLLDDRRAYTPLISGATDLLSSKPDQLVVARVMSHDAVIITVDTPTKPVLPKEAGSVQWNPITEEGRVRRWLITPEPGQSFEAWLSRIKTEQGETASVRVEIPSTDRLSGSDPAVGAWDTAAAIGPGPVEVDLPVGGVVALKTLKQEEDGTIVWSKQPDHFVDVDEAVVKDEPIRLGR